MINTNPFRDVVNVAHDLCKRRIGVAVSVRTQVADLEVDADNPTRFSDGIQLLVR